MTRTVRRARQEAMQTNMRLLYLFSVAGVALIILSGARGLAQSSPNLGTWTLNVAKSKYDPGPPPTSDKRVNEPWAADGYKQISTVVLADGTREVHEFSANYDGKDYKVLGNPAADTIALKRLDANTTEYTLKKSGKIVETGKIVLSSNGKTRTITSTGLNAKGQKFSNLAVFDKQ